MSNVSIERLKLQLDAQLTILSVQLDAMNDAAVTSLRAQVILNTSVDSSARETVLNLIDGHLALRQLQG